MQQPTLDLFFSLLQLGIGTRESLHLRTPLPENTWKELMNLARKQAVTGIVMDGILKLPSECLPPASLKLKGIQQLLRIEQLNRRLNEEAVRVSEYLQGEGYTGIVLKGQGIARYYPTRCTGCRETSTYGRTRNRLYFGNMDGRNSTTKSGLYIIHTCRYWTKPRWNYTSSLRTCSTR